MYRTAEASCQPEWSYEKLRAIRRHMRIPPCTTDEDLNRRLHQASVNGADISPFGALSLPRCARNTLNWSEATTHQHHSYEV